MAGGIEFLDESDDVPPDGPTRRRRPARRWWVLGLVAVSVAAALFALTRPTDRTPQALPTPTSTPTSTPSGVLLQELPDHPLATPTVAAADEPCGGAPMCSVSYQVPTALDLALRGHLASTGSVRDLRVETSLAQSVSNGSSYLAGRVIYLRQRGSLVKISVHRVAGAVPAPDPSAAGVLSVRVLIPSFVIDAYAYPSGHGTRALRSLLPLLRDPRLEVL